MEKNVFTAFSAEKNIDFLEKYKQHLKQRNGVLKLAERELSKREESFRNLELTQKCWEGNPLVDSEVFKRNESRIYPESGLDEVTLWALAMAKSNRLESYGIDYALANLDQNSREMNHPLSYIELEEYYHTRALKNALDTIGLEMKVLPPPPTTRFLLRSMINIPKSISYIMILCTEIAGVGAFSMLRDKGYELFGEQPAVAEYLGKWLQQVLVDEVCHVNYAKSQLGPIRLKVANAILPKVAQGFMKDMPEYKMLFGDKLMDRILEADINSAVEKYNDKFIPNF